MSSDMAGFFEISAICVYIGMLLGLVMTIISFIYHFWKYKNQDVQVNPDVPDEEDGEVYIPPVEVSGAKDKFRLESS